MIKTLYNNESSISNQKSKKIVNTFIFDKAFTPVKLIPKTRKNFNENSLSINIQKGKKPIKLMLKNNKNNDIKLKLLNPTKKNSRNFRNISFLDDFNPYNLISRSNYKSFNTNNSLSATTNLKTTIDSNITKIKNTKEKKNRKENYSFIDNKTNSIFNSSSYMSKKSVNYQIKNSSQIKKRPKIQIKKSNSYNYNKNIRNNTNNNIHITNKTISNDNNLKKITKKRKEKILNYNSSFAIPKRINLMKNIYENILTPIRRNTRIKFKNSLFLNKKINKTEKIINDINKEQKTIDNNRTSLKKVKLKNIYTLLEKQKENICNIDIIKKENKDIDKIMNKIKKLKDKTNAINYKTKMLNEEYIKNKKEISEIKENINNALNDKKKVNSMIILLHRRIIDIKKRIKRHDEQDYYLDKSFYELSLKYKDYNFIQK